MYRVIVAISNMYYIEQIQYTGIYDYININLVLLFQLLQQYSDFIFAHLEIHFKSYCSRIKLYADIVLFFFKIRMTF